MKQLCILVLSQIIVLTVFGQKTKVTGDFRIVTELETVKSISEKWDIGIGVKSWFEKNASQISEVDFDAGIGYSPVKFLTLGVGYRWSKNRNKYGDFITSNRLSGDIIWIIKYKRFKFDYRFRYQNIDDNLFQDDLDNPSQHILRNRIQVKYNIRKTTLTPYLLVEHYGQLGEKIYGLKIKPEMGLTYSISKLHQFKVYYRIDRELNDELPYIYYSLGLGYLFDF